MDRTENPGAPKRRRLLIGLAIVSSIALATVPAIAAELSAENPGETEPLTGPPSWATGDGEDAEDTGPPFNDEERNPNLDWQPGTVGPPPWATGDGEDEEDTGPPFMDEERNPTGWMPGDPGPPPWATGDGEDEEDTGPPFMDEERNPTGWMPGDPGPPPWADEENRGQGGE